MNFTCGTLTRDTNSKHKHTNPTTSSSSCTRLMYIWIQTQRAAWVLRLYPNPTLQAELQKQLGPSALLCSCKRNSSTPPGEQNAGAVTCRGEGFVFPRKQVAKAILMRVATASTRLPRSRFRTVGGTFATSNTLRRPPHNTLLAQADQN